MGISTHDFYYKTEQSYGDRKIKATIILKETLFFINVDLICRFETAKLNRSTFLNTSKNEINYVVI